METKEVLDSEFYNAALKEFKVNLVPVSGDFDSKVTQLSIKKNFKIADIQKYIRKDFKLEKDAAINIFIAETFMVSPSESVYDLKDRFGNKDDTLTLRFSLANTYG
jgi:hypothetical protein